MSSPDPRTMAWLRYNDPVEDGPAFRVRAAFAAGWDAREAEVAELELTGDRAELRSLLDQCGLDFERMRERALKAEVEIECLNATADMIAAEREAWKARLAPLEVEVERLTRERDELKRSLERAEYLLRDLEEWEERTHREATVERLTRERDEARRDAECMRGNADDNYARLQAAEARLARAREALQLPLIFFSGGPMTTNQRDSWLAITGHHEITSKVMCDAIRRALADSEPAGRAAVEESGGERE